jgi:hypothetical protein
MFQCVCNFSSCQQGVDNYCYKIKLEVAKGIGSGPKFKTCRDYWFYLEVGIYQVSLQGLID